MSERVDRVRLLALLQGDEEVLERLCQLGVLQASDLFGPEEVEAAIVARTLVRELEINWAGVEVVLRMRSELIATRAQVADLVRLLERRDKPPQ